MSGPDMETAAAAAAPETHERKLENSVSLNAGEVKQQAGDIDAIIRRPPATWTDDELAVLAEIGGTA